MINIGTLEAILKLRDEMSPKLKIMGKNLEQAGTKMKSAGKSLLPLSLALTAAGVASLKFAIEINKGMANVATLIPGNTERVKDLKEEVQRLAVAHGKPTQDLVGGLYQTISAFGDEAGQTVKILDINSRAATAGLATTLDAINLTSAVTKGYGEVNAEAVEKAADLAFITVKLGQTTFPELAASIGRVVPLASKLGVSQEELFAGFATLTGVTGEAAEVSTQMAAILRGMMKPTESMAKAIKELGFANSETMLSELGMVDSLKALIGTTDGTSESVAKLFGRAESLTAVFALTGGQSDAFAMKLEAMKDASGAMTTAFGEQTEGINKAGFAWEQFKAGLEVAAQKLGDVLLPIVLRTAESLKPLGVALLSLIEGFAEAPEVIQLVVVAFGGIVAAGGPLLMILGSVTTSLGTLGMTAGTTATSFGLLGKAFVVVGVAIGSYKLTEWAMEWTGLRKASDWYYKTMLKVVGITDKIPKSAQQVGTLAQATKIAGREIVNWNEAIKIVTDNLKKQRDSVLHVLTAEQKYIVGLRKATEMSKGAVVMFKTLTDAGWDAEDAIEKVAQKFDADLAEAAEKAAKKLGEVAELTGLVAEAMKRGKEAIEKESKAFEEESRLMEITSVRGNELKFTIEKLRDEHGLLLTETEDYNEVIAEEAERLKEVEDAFFGVYTLMEDTAGWLDSLAGDTTDFSSTWKTSFESAAAVISIFEGTVAESIGNIIGFAMAGRTAGKDLAEAFSSEGGVDWGKAISGAAGAVSAMSAATDPTQGRTKATLSGAVTGASIGSVIPGIGTAIGAVVGGLIGFFRGKRERNLMKEVGESYGIALTQGMAKEITDLAKEIGIEDELATLLKLGDMFEAGMVGTDSFGLMFTDLLAGVKEGTIPVKEGLEGITSAFFAMADAAAFMGDEGVFKIGAMTNEMREMGLMTEEVAQQVNQWIGEGINSLGNYFGYLAEQTDLSGKQAEHSITLMSGAFALAIEQTGSLYAAVMTLPEGFGALIDKLKDTVGAENAAFIEMEKLYSFVKENEGPLSAITALGDALRAFGMAGVLTSEQVSAFGSSMHAEFIKLMDSGANLDTIIAAIGPQLALLYRAYQELGIDVPPWLKDISEKVKEMEPAPTQEEMLSSIENAVWAIAEAFGAVRENVKQVTKSINEMPTEVEIDIYERHHKSNNGNGNGTDFQFGTPGLDFASFGGGTPTTLHGKEAVIPQGGGHELAREIASALGPSRESDMGPITINVMLDGEVIDKRTISTVARASRTGDLDFSDELVDPRL